MQDIVALEECVQVVLLSLYYLALFVRWTVIFCARSHILISDQTMT